MDVSEADIQSVSAYGDTFVQVGCKEIRHNDIDGSAKSKCRRPRFNHAYYLYYQDQNCQILETDQKH